MFTACQEKSTWLTPFCKVMTRSSSTSVASGLVSDTTTRARSGNATLEIVQGDITTLPVDAIVNAANAYLKHGGGVAAAISHKGGPAIQQESDALIEERGPLSTGEAVITSGGKLTARFVIHTVG